MTSDELVSKGTRVLLGDAAASVRSRFIDDYIDTGAEWYRNRIATLKRYSDGDFYSGYLWEVMPNCTRITEGQAEVLAYRLGPAYALWDLHSADKIVAPDYWKFPREAVLHGIASEIYEARTILPRDLYVVKESWDTCLVLTHEDEPDGVAIILEAHPRQRSLVS